MSWAGCSGLSTGLTFALFPTSCSDPALKQYPSYPYGAFSERTTPSQLRPSLLPSCTASLRSDGAGLAVSLQTGSCCVPGRLRPNTTTLNTILNSPNQIFGSVLCSEHRSHWLQDAAVKVQHAYKSCTKNKTNVKLLTASEKIGSSDSAIIAWELCDRKRDSIQFSRVEHCSLAICSFPKFWLILYTA